MHQASLDISLGSSLGHWRVLAASVQGLSHEKNHQVCQDAHCWKTLTDNTLVAVVADGAGSALLAELGAAIVAQSVVREICSTKESDGLPQDDNEWKLLLTAGLKAGLVSVQNEAAERGTSERDLASTAIAIVSRPGLVAAAQVGDGGVVVGDSCGNIITLTTPQSGEYVNETDFLTTSGAIEKAQMAVWRGAVAHVTVFCDGLQMLALKLPAYVPHYHFFLPLFSFVNEPSDASEAQSQLVDFLRSPRIRGRTDDDLTLLLASIV